MNSYFPLMDTLISVSASYNSQTNPQHQRPEGMMKDYLKPTCYEFMSMHVVRFGNKSIDGF